MKLLRRLFCRHHFAWVANLRGVEIEYSGNKLSVWRCLACGREQYRDYKIKDPTR